MTTSARELTTDEEIQQLVTSLRRIAVLGIKTETQADQPSFYVPAALQKAGVEIVPVPLYYPRITEILGEIVYRKLTDVPGDLDLVDVFRRPEDLDGHFDEIVAKRPGAVWLQSGIRNDAFAQKLIAAGISVVQDRCLMVEHKRFATSA